MNNIKMITFIKYTQYVKDNHKKGNAVITRMQTHTVYQSMYK